MLGSGEHCRPCPCPSSPSSGHFNAHSCQAEPTTDQIACNCKSGFTGTPVSQDAISLNVPLDQSYLCFSISPSGPRCNKCAPGYYGNPEETGGQCQPCQCNNNINVMDPESCDPRSGQCLKCLNHTEGPSCAHCQLGYYGDALTHGCRREQQQRQQRQVCFPNPSRLARLPVCVLRLRVRDVWDAAVRVQRRAVPLRPADGSLPLQGAGRRSQLRPLRSSPLELWSGWRLRALRL